MPPDVLIFRSGVVWGAKEKYKTWSTQFGRLLERNPDKTNIVAEGDSWFSFTWEGRSSILDHVAARFVSIPHAAANMLRLASRGEEATETFSESDSDFVRALQDFGPHVDLVLLSGGGNDLVDEYLRPIVRDYRTGMSAQDCINPTALQERLNKISDAFSHALAIIHRNAPNAYVVCHTYDYVMPMNKPARINVLGVSVVKGPWIWNILDEKHIPDELMLPIAKHLLEELKTVLRGLATNDERFIVVDTQGTLNPGTSPHWEDEMHPTEAGFELLAEKYYERMRQLRSDLPNW